MAIVGKPAAVWPMALNPGANQYTGPAFSAKACFLVAVNTTTSVSKGREANEWSTYLEVNAENRKRPLGHVKIFILWAVLFCHESWQA